MMKNFNSFYTGLDTSALQKFIMTAGQRLTFAKGEIFSYENDIPTLFGWIEKGGFRYTHIDQDGKEYNVGFSFAGEALADYYNFLLGDPSEVYIRALAPSEVMVITRAQFRMFEESSPDNMRTVKAGSERFGSYTYRRLLRTYTDTAEERYLDLTGRCPEIFGYLSLKEIASYLGITPETVSHIRRKLL